MTPIVEGAHGAVLFVKTVVLPFFAAAWWLNPTEANGLVTTWIGILTTAAIGYIAIAGIFEKRSREKAKQDFAEEMERRRITEEFNKNSLTAQMAEIKRQAQASEKKAAADFEESKANQEAMRKTLHQIRDELHTRILENQLLHDDLHKSHEDYVAMSAQLVEANKQIASLRTELVAANRQITQLTSDLARIGRDEAKRSEKTDALMRKVEDVHDSIKASTASLSDSGIHRVVVDPDREPTP